jgi:hypothetical protein
VTGATPSNAPAFGRVPRTRALPRLTPRALQPHLVRVLCHHVGHSPTNEAAVIGLASEIVEPISKGGGVLVVDEDGSFQVENLG